MLRVIWSFAHVMQSEMPIVLRVDEMLPFLMGFLNCVPAVVQTCTNAEAIMQAFLSFVADMSQAQGKTIDISAWRVRYLSCHQFALQCIQQWLCTICHVCLDISMHVTAK